MAKRKLSTAELLRRVDAGDSYADIAKDHGITRQAVYNRVRKLRGKTTKAIAVRTKKVAQVVDQKLDAMAQLQRVNEVANQLLDELTGEDRAIDGLVKAVEGSLVYEGDPIRQKEHIRQVILRVNQDKNTALKACGEIRNQLRLQLEIFQTLFDMKAVEEFQQEVLAAIGEASPETRNAIISKLNQRRAIRSTVRFN